MTISLDKQNKVASVVKTRWNLLTESIAPLGIASLLVAGIATISGHQLASNLATVSLALTTVQTSVQSKERDRQNQLGLTILDREQILLNNRVETLESNSVSKYALTKLEIKLQELMSSLVSVQLKLAELETQSSDRDLATTRKLSVIKSKISRINNQILTNKVLSPSTVNDVQKLQEQVEVLGNAVETLSRQKTLRLPTTNECSELPPKQPERPLCDRLGFFIDGANVSISAKKLWGCYVDWAKLLVLLGQGSADYKARYYDALSKNKYGLFHAIEKIGYEVISKPLIQRGDGSAKGNLDTELSNDMLACADLYDTFVLVSCDGDFTDTVKKLRTVGKRVELVSFKGRTNKELIKAADSYTDLTPLQDQLGC